MCEDVSAAITDVLESILSATWSKTGYGVPGPLMLSSTVTSPLFEEMEERKFCSISTEGAADSSPLTI